MCRIFPRRFVLPLNVDHDTPYTQNLIDRPDTTATATRTDKHKVGDQHDVCVSVHDEILLDQFS